MSLIVNDEVKERFLDVGEEEEQQCEFGSNMMYNCKFFVC